ncbi:hypothetical protein BSIN_3529 [Burkholderia singularis]|uniref:Uncharacterized protein n=1 Tax=Burkholderia singularis TaxID=1503053 RepID=A0A238H556_9BURK|nr:hypothetical protein BSIN_3529 [Burkholderia singularis]
MSPDCVLISCRLHAVSTACGLRAAAHGAARFQPLCCIAHARA